MYRNLLDSLSAKSPFRAHHGNATYASHGTNQNSIHREEPKSKRQDLGLGQVDSWGYEWPEARERGSTLDRERGHVLQTHP